MAGAGPARRDGGPRQRRRAAVTEPTHLVDATMFWSATGGGVRRYLLAKQHWLARATGVAAHDRRAAGAWR